jgi:hypothetical protein
MGGDIARANKCDEARRRIATNVAKLLELARH